MEYEASDNNKSSKFTGANFKRWQNKMFFYLHTKKCEKQTNSIKPIVVDPPTKESTKAIEDWIENDFLCRFFILNGLNDELYDYYSSLTTAKEVWDALQKKYDTEEAGSKKYAVSRYLRYQMVDDKTFSVDMVGYNSYSKLYLSIFYAFSYGLGFASFTATITHVALHHGKIILSHVRKAKDDVEGKMDVYGRLMKANYAPVRQWWFHVILVSVLGLSLLTCLGFNAELQLPWWGLIMTCGMSFLFTLPIGIIRATSNMYIWLDIDHHGNGDRFHLPWTTCPSSSTPRIPCHGSLPSGLLPNCTGCPVH